MNEKCQLMGDKFEKDFIEIFPEFGDNYGASIKTRFKSFLEAIVMNKKPEADQKKDYVQDDLSSSIES